ncbi:2-oxo-4-hydroxy-4-carboxy-5-ureidoimidazoline decarboxylase [Nesterenkonia aurantiaca]|uniref:2-oxo-4-hydroxy-4-carboxy-5-ureidoimidazoline decarboxylase n=1 Tax=Nesterenkonia aurantiaca TaxID=1436010 RepID=UPI003EE5F590
MRLTEFNAASPEELKELLDACVPIPSWRAALLARRPYAHVEQLTQVATEIAQDWTDLEVDAALAHHPRIGEKVQGETREAQASRREQGSLSQDEAAQQEWISANRAYEDRFDRIFLIRAAGRTPAQMMTQLQLRLQNTPEEEASLRRGQLAEIAVGRLEHSVS